MKIKKRYVIFLMKSNKLEYLHFNNIATFNMYKYILDRDNIPYTAYEEMFYEEY